MARRNVTRAARGPSEKGSKLEHEKWNISKTTWNIWKI
jgi:hypothetical protein